MASNAGSPPATTPSAAPAAATRAPSVDVKPILSRQPSLLMKPAQTPPATSPTSSSSNAPLSLTSKEWVIPPRPKPGRKPATDTPPTKRKAQNRAAQRAFRERRAARVGELEEQMKQIEDEHDAETEQLKVTVDHLEKEVEQYRADLVNWVDRCRRLEAELTALKATARASSAKPTEPAQAQTHGHGHTHDKNPVTTSTGDTSVGCGGCTLETRCQCIDEAFQAMSGEDATPSHHPPLEKRPHSPNPASGDLGDKRIKLEPKESLEIDFTNAYASKPAPAQRSPASAVADPCGFCSDGTPCICAEMAAEQEEAQNAVVALPSRAGASRQLSQFTPPPSEGDVSISVPASAAPAGCASGPGTCSQCRADPNSTLFCKSLAASRAQASGTPSGCCGGGSPGGGCCRQPSTPLRTTRSRAALNVRPPKVGVTLTCADAYTTLSRHPAYERASSDIATWLPKLHASDANQSAMGRPALEIDAANVMAVLKDFDRRFGQNC